LDNDSIQAVALSWVFRHKRSHLVDLVTQLGQQLDDRALLRVALMAKADPDTSAGLASFVLGTPNNPSGAMWLTLWGTQDEALKMLTNWDAGLRAAAAECLAFRDDIETLRRRMVATNSPVVTFLLKAVDRSAWEHGRIRADLSSAPPALAQWRAEIDKWFTFGGQLMLRAAFPDKDLELR